MREEPSQSDLLDYSGASGDEEDAADGDDTPDVDGDEIESVEGGTDGTDGSDSETDAGDAAGTLPDASCVDPATPTYRWAPEGAACDSCGSVVKRRWVEDDPDGAPAFVCDDCKEW